MFQQQQQPYPGWGAPPMWQQPQYRPPDDGGIQNVRTVANEAEARQCVCPLGSRVLLMDAGEPRFYVKETDFNNVSTMKAYEFHEVTDAPKQSDYITRAEFEEWKANHESTVQSETDRAATGYAEAAPDDGPVHTRAGEGRGGAHRR